MPNSERLSSITVSMIDAVNFQLMKYKFVLFLAWNSFVPTEVDGWFRNLCKELKEERQVNPPQHEDVFQMILNTAEKIGKRKNLEFYTRSTLKILSYRNG